MTTQNGFAIRAFRENNTKLDPAGMALLVGVSAAHYRKIEAETRDAQPSQIAKIARACNVPAAALMRTPPGTVPVATPTHVEHPGDAVVRALGSLSS